MSDLLLGTLPSLPAVVDPPVDPRTTWPGVQSLLWFAANGEVIDLLDTQQGVILLQEGFEGLHFPAIDSFTVEAAQVDGSRWTGSRIKARDVAFQVEVYSSASSAEWVARDERVWAAFDPLAYGVLQIQVGGTFRRLQMRPVVDGSYAYARDPHRSGWARYLVEGVCDEPAWVGDPVQQHWRNPEPRGSWLTPGPGYLFDISSSSTTSSATLANPGRLPTWVVWTLEGQVASATVGVGSRTIEVPFEVPDGQRLVIDTRPASRGAFLGSPDRSARMRNGDEDGTALLASTIQDVTRLLGARRYAQLSPGSAVPVSASYVGSGSLSATLWPRHLRAWG